MFFLLDKVIFLGLEIMIWIFLRGLEMRGKE